MRLTYFHRRPTQIHYSLEQLFDGIRKGLPKSIVSQKWVAPCYSQGLWPRVKMSLAARRAQGDVNHITGDIHFIALALKKRKTILTIHDLGILNNTSNPLARWVLKTLWITLPVRCVRFVTVVSEATKKDLLRLVRIPEAKVRVIGNFISPAFTPYHKVFNGSKPIILHIGSAYNKNLTRSIHALKGLSCHLMVVGNPSETDRALLLEYQIEHTIVSGLTEQELVGIYRQCDILLFASTLEGFGIPILEAQATGRVVVTSNLSSMPEVAGEGACLVDPYQVASIRGGLERVIIDENFREALIKKGFENAKRFSLQEVVAKYTALYDEIYDSKDSIYE